MDIHCDKCSKYVGDIKPGSRIAKGTKYTCSKCSAREVFDRELDYIVGEKSVLGKLKRYKNIHDF